MEFLKFSGEQQGKNGTLDSYLVMAVRALWTGFGRFHGPGGNASPKQNPSAYETWKMPKTIGMKGKNFQPLRFATENAEARDPPK